MMTDEAIKKIHDQLESHGKKLENIQTTLQHIAVQDEQIKTMRMDIQAIWKKYDAAFGPKGTIPDIQQHQASCPRNQIKWLWIAVIPFGILNLTVAVKILASMAGAS